MSKASRKRRRDERSKAKKAKKAAYTALAGVRREKKEHVRAQKSVFKGAHIMANCGNTGCKKCFPELNRSWVAKKVA